MSNGQKHSPLESLRRFFFHNFWLKVLALVLSLIIYLTLRSGVNVNNGGYFTGMPAKGNGAAKTEQADSDDEKNGAVKPAARPPAKTTRMSGAKHNRSAAPKDSKDKKANAKR